jgi:cytochrome c peroxidase
MKKFILPILVIVISVFLVSGTIDLSNLFNYSNQTLPVYITKDNTTTNPISDEGATLGRVLFYDKNLSANNTIACASCHKQEFAFGDTGIASIGLNGATGRHSMRLINARFADEVNFFWDERAATLEDQTTMPIQDHIEMGFSGTNGDPDLDSLRRKLATIDYYKQLFTFVYGDTIVTEQRMQNALAQFVRSIQSFDSKFDTGRAIAPNDGAPFTNFTTTENAGKALFLAPPQFDVNGNRIGGGAGCQGCHRAPEFDIDPNSNNNGVVGVIGGGQDLTNTRAPSLRDVVKADGSSNGEFMHDGSLNTILDVINHYDSIVIIPGNNTLDNRLRPGGNPQNLQLTTQEKVELEAFIKTLSGSDVYTNPIWSNPFTNDSITITGTTSISFLEDEINLNIYPNPFTDVISIQYPNKYLNTTIEVYSLNGKMVKSLPIATQLDLSDLTKGRYFVRIGEEVKKVIKQ